MPKRVLMCRPDFFDIEYEINPWMKKSNQVNQELAEKQWLQIHDIYNTLGIDVERIAPVDGLPDMVFTANGGMVIDGRVALPRFLNPERQGETTKFDDWFRANGFEETILPKNNFEGEGDCLFAQDTLFAGHGFRSDIKSHPELADFFGKEVVSLHLVNPSFYHLDTCFCPLNDEVVMYFPGAFDQDSQAVISKRFKTVIEASPRDAAAFGLNAVPIGKNVVLSNQATGLHQQLKEHGLNPITTPITEFHKSGGGVKCLTLELRS